MKNILLIFISLLGSMCHSDRPIAQNVKAVKANAPLIIYKTKGDFSNNIPIVLNLSKDKIQSYPAIGDIYSNEKFARPDQLEKGYLLDNFGLSPQSVYTSYTFEEYAQLKKVPSLQEWMDRIIETDPIVEMYHCGNRVDLKNTHELNALIANHFNNCKKIK